MIRIRNHSDAHAAQGKSTDAVLFDDAQLHTHSVVSNSITASDISFSAPKPVSILALVLNDPHVLEAHKAAVNECLRHMEALAQAKARGSQP